MATRESMNTFLKHLRAFKTEIKRTGIEVLDELTKVAENEISSSVSSSDYESSEPVQVFNKGKRKIRRVGISGSQAIYDEFGTGTVGANNPHPEKSNYNLNDYNSGKTIRPNSRKDTEASKQGIPLNGLYWTYKFNGEKIYTQGRPAGMHVYKGHNQVKKVMEKLINDKVGDVLSKL